MFLNFLLFFLLFYSSSILCIFVCVSQSLYILAHTHMCDGIFKYFTFYMYGIYVQTHERAVSYAHTHTRIHTRMDIHLASPRRALGLHVSQLTHMACSEYTCYIPSYTHVSLLYIKNHIISFSNGVASILCNK